MSMLSFGLILVNLIFNIIVALVYALLRFPKCSSSFFLKMIMFSKDSFKIPLCCDFLRCICSFISLEKV
jgi:hypothetical protein